MSSFAVSSFGLSRTTQGRISPFLIPLFVHELFVLKSEDDGLRTRFERGGGAERGRKGGREEGDRLGISPKGKREGIGGEAAALFSTGASQTEYLLAQTKSPSVKEKSSRSYFCEEKYAKKFFDITYFFGGNAKLCETRKTFPAVFLAHLIAAFTTAPFLPLFHLVHFRTSNVEEEEEEEEQQAGRRGRGEYLFLSSCIFS